MTRVYLGVGLALALAGLGWFGYHKAHRGGYEAGSAAVRAEWHRERARVAEAAREALAREYARHQEVERGLSEKLAAADRRGRDLARRLQGALAAARMPSECPAAPAPDGPAGESGDEGEVGEALAAHLAACERDAERFAELQSLVR